MKSYGHIWDKITSRENLMAAWSRVRKGHPRSTSVAEFEVRLQENIDTLRAELLSGSYMPSKYHQFRIFDPKPRTISCAPVRDRVVHQALCAIVAPLLERGFSEVSFACRRGKGAHRACCLARKYAARHAYFCKMDVRHYFDSIDHGKLLTLLSKKFREEHVRELLRRIVEAPVSGLDGGYGLPVGNLTSQWFANFYLDEFDHMASTWFGSNHPVASIRYMDDFVFFGETKALMWKLHDLATVWLKEQRNLDVKSEATVIAPVSEGVPFLGLRIFAGSWRLKRSRFLHTRRTMRLREKQHDEGHISDQRFGKSLAAMDGGLRWFGFKGILASGKSTESGSSRSIRGYNNRNGNNYNATSFNRYGGDPSSNRYNNNGNNTYLGFRLSSTLSGQCQGPARDAGAPRMAETNMPSLGCPVAQATATPGTFHQMELLL